MSHSIGEGERIMADAVMYYTVVESEHRRKLRAFVEVDRSTMSSERLAVKLIEYARLFQYEAQPVGRRRQATAGPAWLRWYPVFPRVLFVLTGASRARLENRMSDLQAMVAQHPSWRPSPGKSGWEPPCLKTWSSTVPPRTCGCLWPAAGLARGRICEPRRKR